MINVEDMDSKIELVKKAGGDEMGIALAIISDTEGNRVGILQDL